jgi:dTDP-4-dehydrorhamnose reductase/UDP-glucose 4-epimerase
MAETNARLLVVGQNSFIAGHLLSVLPEGAARAVSHGDLDQPDLLDGVEVVINAARHPQSSREDYDLETLDLDLRLARRIGDLPVRMIMLSSRKVYAQSDRPLTEDAPTGPADAYGANKLRAEHEVNAILGERLTILRLANIFGDERVPGRRSFLAILLNRLAEQNQILYDMSPFVERDFLPAETLAVILAKIAKEPPGGILNIGSGIPLPTGRIALWIMEGFGGGELLIEKFEEKDRFVLDVAKLKERFGTPCSVDDLRSRCLDLGRRLRADQPSGS